MPVRANMKNGQGNLAATAASRVPNWICSPAPAVLSVLGWREANIRQGEAGSRTA